MHLGEDQHNLGEGGHDTGDGEGGRLEDNEGERLVGIDGDP